MGSRLASRTFWSDAVQQFSMKHPKFMAKITDFSHLVRTQRLLQVRAYISGAFVRPEVVREHAAVFT